MTRIAVLGGVQVVGDDGVDVTPAGRIPVRLLAALTASAPGSATVDDLKEAAWGPEPPPTAESALRTHLARVRRAVDGGLESRGRRYRLTAPDAIDLVQYEQLVGRARARDLADDARLEVLTTALELWQGRPWGELADEPWLASHVRARETRHLAVEEEWGDLVVALGRSQEHAGRLWDQAVAEPLREHRWATLITALRSTGRTADAVRAYEVVRAALAEELGTRPGPALSAAYDSLFEQDRPRAAQRGALGPLVGRGPLLDVVAARLAGGEAVTLVGVAGMGKSRLARELVAGAHRRGERAWFFEVPPASRVHRLRRDLAAQASVTAPTEADAEEALLARLAGLDLLVLDGAQGCTDEVAVLIAVVRERRPNLRVVVTCRRPLGHRDEVPVTVPPLSLPVDATSWRGTSVELLAARRGIDVAADPDIVEDLVAECRPTGGVPLLLELTATSGPPPPGVTSPAERVAATAVELLDDLERPTRDLATAMALLPGGVSADLGARLLGGTARSADRRLRHLAWLGLTQVSGSPRRPLHTLLDPVGEAVVDRLGAEADTERAAARDGLVDHLLDLGTRIRPSLAEPPDMGQVRELDALATGLRSVLDERDARYVEVAAGAAEHLGTRGHAGEAGAWLGSALADADRHRRATAALTAARIGRLGGNVVAVADLLVEAVGTFREVDDGPAAAFAALYGAIGRSYQGRLDDAEALLTRPPSGDGRNEWIDCLFDLTAGWLELLRGRFEPAVAQIAAAADRLEEVDLFGASLAHFVLVASLQVDPPRARARLPRARSVAESIGDRPMTAGLLFVEAEMAGGGTAAVPLLREAALALDAAGLPERAAIARVRAGTILLGDGDRLAARVELLAAAPPLRRARTASTLVALAGLAAALAVEDRPLADELAGWCRASAPFRNGYVDGSLVVLHADSLLGDLGNGEPAPGRDPDAALDHLLHRARLRVG